MPNSRLEGLNAEYPDADRYEMAIEDVEEVSDDSDNDLFIDGESDNSESDGEALLDDSTILFGKHTTTPLCCAIHPNDSVVVTGDSGNKLIIWDVNTRDVLYEMDTEHNNGIMYVAFNHDGTLFVTGDHTGHFVAWEFQDRRKLNEIKGMVGKPFLIFWHKTENALFGETGPGDVLMWCVPCNTRKLFPSFGSRVCHAKQLPDGKRMALCHEDGYLRIWNLSTFGLLVSVFVELDEYAICRFDMDFSYDSSMCLINSKYGSLKLINALTGKLLKTFYLDDAPIEGIAFSPRSFMAVAGTDGGTYVILDASTQTIIQKIENLSIPFKMMWHPTGEKFFFNSMNTLRLVDALLGSVEGVWHVSEQMHDYAVTSDGRRIVTCDNVKCAVFEVST